MDAYTVFKLDFTFDVWTSTSTDGGLTFAYRYYKSSNGLLVPGVSQTYMFTKEILPTSAALRSVKDAKGNAVFEEFDTDVDRYVVSAEPLFDYQGILNGYRNVLRRDLPSTPVGGSH